MFVNYMNLKLGKMKKKSKPKTELLTDSKLDRFSNNGWNLHLLTLDDYNAIYVFRKENV